MDVYISLVICRGLPGSVGYEKESAKLQKISDPRKSSSRLPSVQNKAGRGALCLCMEEMKDTALLVIDMQRDFVEADGALRPKCAGAGPRWSMW